MRSGCGPASWGYLVAASAGFLLISGPLPTDDQAMIATLGGLRKELEKLNQLAWQADEDTILGWADTEGYPVDGTIDADGQYSKADIPNTLSMTLNPWPGSPSPCSGGPCGFLRNSRCPSCLTIKEDSSGRWRPWSKNARQIYFRSFWTTYGMAWAWRKRAGSG